jgi:hypothetical protein
MPTELERQLRRIYASERRATKRGTPFLLSFERWGTGIKRRIAELLADRVRSRGRGTPT